MDRQLIEIEDVKNVFKKVGFKPDESEVCMGWTSPEMEEPLTSGDHFVAELTPEEEGYLRCMGYAFNEKKVDPLRMRALYETFWKTVRSLRNLPPIDLTIKEGKYIVAR
jgi:hypothetical protein